MEANANATGDATAEKSEERITSAEVRISNTEDDMVSLQAKVQSLEDKKRELEDKVTDLEARSRRSNLRLVNLPERVEGTMPALFSRSGSRRNWISQH